MDAKVLDKILGIAFEKRVSDVHFEVDNPPFFRGRGQLIRSKLPSLTPVDTEFIAKTILEQNGRALSADLKEVDAAYALPDGGRFRVSIFRQRRHLGVVMRVIPPNIGSFKELQLPSVLAEIAKAPNGLILVTGPTGNGKSTTLASILEFLNETQSYNIITIEDPIEFLFTSKKSCIIQREVGIDTHGFDQALRAALRMDPDVIMVGEMRDTETIDACLKAAETGHLVFSTLHTVNAVQTVERVLAFFPPHHHNLIRMQLSMLLEGVVSQRLVNRAGKYGRVPACEVLLGTPTVREMLAEGKTRDLPKAIREGAEYFGTQTFNQSLANLIRQNDITLEEGLQHSDNPGELKLEMRGISKGRAAQIQYDTAY